VWLESRTASGGQRHYQLDITSARAHAGASSGLSMEFCSLAEEYKCLSQNKSLLSLVPRPALSVMLTALLSAPAAGTRRRCPQLSIDISCPQGAQQQTRRPPLLLSIDGTDRRTYTRPLRRPCSAYYAGNISRIVIFVAY